MWQIRDDYGAGYIIILEIIFTVGGNGELKDTER